MRTGKTWECVDATLAFDTELGAQIVWGSNSHNADRRNMDGHMSLGLGLF